MKTEEPAIRAWIGHCVDAPEDGAALVFAHTHREARRHAWYALSEMDVDWIDVRVRLLEHQEQFMPHYPGSGPIGILDIPKDLMCGNCKMWGGLIGDAGLCVQCDSFRREFGVVAGLEEW